MSITPHAFPPSYRAVASSRCVYGLVRCVCHGATRRFLRARHAYRSKAGRRSGRFHPVLLSLPSGLSSQAPLCFLYRSLARDTGLGKASSASVRHYRREGALQCMAAVCRGPAVLRRAMQLLAHVGRLSLFEDLVVSSGLRRTRRVTGGAAPKPELSSAPYSCPSTGEGPASPDNQACAESRPDRPVCSSLPLRGSSDEQGTIKMLHALWFL